MGEEEKKHAQALAEAVPDNLVHASSIAGITQEEIEQVDVVDNPFLEDYHVRASQAADKIHEDTENDENNGVNRLSVESGVSRASHMSMEEIMLEHRLERQKAKEEA